MWTARGELWLYKKYLINLKYSWVELKKNVREAQHVNHRIYFLPKWDQKINPWLLPNFQF